MEGEEGGGVSKPTGDDNYSSVRMCSTGTFECVHVNYVCVVCEREVTGMF